MILHENIVIKLVQTLVSLRVGWRSQTRVAYLLGMVNQSLLI